MKILQIFNRYLEKGGEEIFVDQFTHEVGQRHEIRNLIFDSADWRSEPLWLKILQPLRMVHNPSAAHRIRHAVREFLPDIAVVHNVFPVGSLAVYRTLHQLGIPIVQYIHNFRPFSINGYCWTNGRICDSGLRGNFLPEVLSGSWQNSRIKTGIYASVLSIGHILGIWSKVSRWIAISHFMKNAFVGAGITEAKIDVISHAMDSTPAPVKIRSAVDCGNRLLFLGRISEEKGIRVLAAAWKQIESLRSTGILVVAGLGPMSAWLKQELQDCKRVEILGLVSSPEKDALIQSCQAMIVPSQWWEPFGLVVLEAYRNSKPVLAAASGGLAEIVIPNLTGWLHEPGDVDTLVSQMIEVLDNPIETKNRGDEGHRWLESHASMKNWHRQLEKSLDQALQG